MTTTIACSTTATQAGDYWMDSVPVGGQIIQSFELTPSLPDENGQRQTWKLINPCVENPDPITSVTIVFSSESTQEQRFHERAVLVIKLQQNPEEDGVWRFALNGVQVKQVQGDDSDIGVEISDDGSTLTAYVHVYESGGPEIQFGYVASFTNNYSGEITTYESGDPDFTPTRPK